ncbi:hypothetical protein SAMN04487896_3455 [Paenibacillus sp. ov031]|uniref:hypothetical protein n=1 Tax=unclassified Paenibacillus TaxID=185978 RepID=UPI00088CE1D3|nr:MULTISPECIES: hypothetical protein [unclassified Paenibacillus]SDL25697.1 hypothetical protein SAMN05428961_104428 [Paenibacillus sp. OK060]SHN74347.1 hypothetical protein SAMN04487896_3455 [Paenibacillus sp. ov031]
MLRRRNRNALLKKIGFIALVLLLLWLIVRTIPYLFRADAPDEAASIAQEFYKYEQTGDFGSSWELFHPLMKERFPKSAYLQSRAHIFMQHFGVETFDLEMEKPEREFDVTVIDGVKPFAEAYRIGVTQKFTGTFGQFKIVQNCYIVKDGDDWTLLWYYPKNGDTETQHDKTE